MAIVWTCHLVSFSDHSLSLYINTIWSYEILLVDFGILARAINKSGKQRRHRLFLQGTESPVKCLLCAENVGNEAK